MEINKDKYIRKLFLMIFLFWIIPLTGCISDAQVDDVDSETHTILPDIDILPTETLGEDLLITPIIDPFVSLTCESHSILVNDIRPDKYWWSNNSQQLFFIDGMERFGVYDLESGEVQISESDTIIPSVTPPELPNQVLQEVAEDNIHLSPSGGQVLYEVRIYSRPTSTPNSEGIPSNLPEFTRDIFWIKNGETSPVLLGRIDGQLGDYAWSKDETRVLFGMFGFPGSAYIWLADLSTESLSQVLPVNGKKNKIVLVDITPDGKNAIYSRDNELWIKNLETGDEGPLLLENFRKHWWLSDTRILFIGDMIQNQSHYSIGVYDYEVDQYSLIADVNINTPYYWIGEIVLSPDKTKIAYVDRSRNLSILYLCLPNDMFAP